MIRPIVQWPDPLLTTRRSFPVFPSEAVDKLVADMFETMKVEGGCGLAAVQVGVPVRLFVLEVGGAREVCLNPEWTPWRGTQPVLMDEGCLSVLLPLAKNDKVAALQKGLGKYFRAMVPRYERINVEYMTQQGSPVKTSFRGLKAQAFQHEHEHLEGKIFLDHLSEDQRESLREALES